MTGHPARRAADLLLYGAHADLVMASGGPQCLAAQDVVLQELVCVPQQIEGEAVRSLEVERITEEQWPGRLVLWSSSRARASTLQCELGLRSSEVYIITSPDAVRGLHCPVYVCVDSWRDLTHVEVTRHYLKHAKGLDITDQQELIELVVARIVSLRHAVERKEHGAR